MLVNRKIVTLSNLKIRRNIMNILFIALMLSILIGIVIFRVTNPKSKSIRLRMEISRKRGFHIDKKIKTQT